MVRFIPIRRGALILIALSVCGCSRSHTIEQQAQTPSAEQSNVITAPYVPYVYDFPIGPAWLRPSGERAADPEPSSQLAPAPEPAPVAEAPTETKPSAPSRSAKSKSSKPAASNSASASASKSSNNRLSITELRKKYPDSFKFKGDSSSPQAALTFDDAPDETYTAQVLDILKKHQVKATFFVVGWRAEKYPQLVKRIAKEGHHIGNHTYGHQVLTKLSDEKYQAEITKTEKVINRLIGYTPAFLRPPYGEINESQLLWAAHRNMTVINWNVDSEDWKKIDQTKIVSNVMKDVKPGCIVLQHSGGGEGQDLTPTIQALPVIIAQLKEKGYSLVTLAKLLQLSERQD